MPSIADLAAASGVSDTDELPISQDGTTRRATRLQVLAGVQPRIALAQGELLGRLSSGSGAPEAVSVGANLTLTGGSLSAPTPYAPVKLPFGRPAGGSDLVPIVQGGVDAVLPYAQFMSGLGGLAGFDLSQHRAAGAGAPYTRSLAAFLGDAATAEEFGAVGDGTTDDTAALAAAAATGRPVRLGPRSYAVRGQWTIAVPVVFIGTPGITRLVRPAQDFGGAWISVQAALEAHGIVFDATCPAASGTWGVLVTADCPSSSWVECEFVGAAGPLGCGLSVLPASDTARHRVIRCELAHNGSHGVWICSGVAAEIIGCRSHDNVGYGLCVDDNDPQLIRRAERSIVRGNQAWSNQRGISVGNPNQTNLEPPLWGILNPDVVGAVIEGNQTWDNVACGIAAFGDALLVQGNRVEEAGTGLQIQASRSRVGYNQVLGGQYGIDLGGSADIEIAGNQVFGSRIGINPGGGQGVRLIGNHVASTEWAVTAYAVETDGRGATLGPPATDLAITANRFDLGGGGGVLLADGIEAVEVRNNHFVGNDASQALVPLTPAATISQNTWNGLSSVSTSSLAGTEIVRIADVADEAWITMAPTGISTVEGAAAGERFGQVTWITVTSPGSNYSHAAVTISGDGHGGQAIALVRNGSLIGIRVLAGGAGYTSAVATISGDGQGAVASVQLGLPVVQGRRLRLRAVVPLRLAASGLANWAGMDVWLPAGAVAELYGDGGHLVVASSPEPALAYMGRGDVAVQPAGDLYLRPSGALHLTNAVEAVGCLSLLGRGDPRGQVAAPPGSDYRNLDGGIGQTLWVKQTGTDTSGWAAIG